MKTKSALILAIILTLPFASSAAFVESNLTAMNAAGTKAVNVDTSTNLGWLDLRFTSGMSYNQVENLISTDPRFSGFRFPTLSEHNEMIKKVFPSLFTAKSFYQTSKYQPIVNATESLYYRKIFNNGNYTYGLVFDEPTGNFHWSGSNNGSGGLVGYSNAYVEPDGRPLNKSSTIFSSQTNWYLVAEGKVNIDGSFSLEVEDVNSPALPLTGCLALLMLSTFSLRRKCK